MAETIDRLVETVTGAGLVVFARIDHGAGALEVGAPLRPTELLIFGNPKGGTPLMQDRQISGHRPARQGARLGRWRRRRLAFVQ